MADIGAREPNVDIQDRGDSFVLTAELPGYDKEEVEANVSSNVLELKAERRSEKEDKSGEKIQRQTFHSYFHKYLTLPEEVVSEKVSGTMKNGVLELKLPKKELRFRGKTKRVNLK